MAGEASGSEGRQEAGPAARRLAHDHARLPAVADRGRAELELIVTPLLSAGTSQSGPAVVTALGRMVVPGGQPCTRGRVAVVVIVCWWQPQPQKHNPPARTTRRAFRPSKALQRVFRMANLPCRDLAAAGLPRSVDDDPDHAHQDPDSTLRDKKWTAEKNAA